MRSSGRSLGALQRAYDGPHHARLRAGPDEGARPPDIEFDRMRGHWRRRPRRRRRTAACGRFGFHDDGNEAVRKAQILFRLGPRFAAPREELLRRHPVLPSDGRRYCVRFQRRPDGRAFSSSDQRGRPPPPVITSTRRPAAAFGSSVRSSLDTSRSPMRSANSLIPANRGRWGKNTAYPTTTLSTTAATPGTSSSNNPGTSYPSECAIGRTCSDQ